YHSALWARERDRLRQAILEDLGWKFHRIWSTDWFYRRDQEITRLRLRLEEASKEVLADVSIRGANANVGTPSDLTLETPRDLERNSTEIETIQITVPPYKKAEL